MAKVAWVLVLLVAGLGFLLLLVSANAPVMQQAAVGSMVTGFVVCVAAIAYAVTAMRRN